MLGLLGLGPVREKPQAHRRSGSWVRLVAADGREPQEPPGQQEVQGVRNRWLWDVVGHVSFLLPIYLSCSHECLELLEIASS